MTKYTLSALRDNTLTIMNFESIHSAIKMLLTVDPGSTLKFKNKIGEITIFLKNHKDSKYGIDILKGEIDILHEEMKPVQESTLTVSNPSVFGIDRASIGSDESVIRWETIKYEPSAKEYPEGTVLTVADMPSITVPTPPSYVLDELRNRTTPDAVEVPQGKSVLENIKRRMEVDLIKTQYETEPTFSSFNAAQVLRQIREKKAKMELDPTSGIMTGMIAQQAFA